MTLAPVRSLLLSAALLFTAQAQAQLDDLFRNPGSPPSAPVERKPKSPAPHSATAAPSSPSAPAAPAKAAQPPTATTTQSAGAAEPAHTGGPAHTTDDRVVIYTTPTCPHCHRALKHMQTRKIPYLQKDVQHNAENRAEFKRIGGRGVPHILIGDQVMVGFSTQGFDQRHARWKSQSSASR